MTSSSPAPKLPLWIFFVTDAALIVAAFFIGSSAPRPWSETTVIAVMSCVIVGAFVLFVPVISYYERAKNDMLDDRQRALEGLARTLGASAEQISIATGSLNEIADLAQRNLRQAEQLPHKLQEKIAEFQAQLANANEAEKEELEKELEELRSSETERIQSVADRVAKAVAELTRLEAASSQHLAAANEAVSKLGFGTAGAISKAQAAAEQAFVHARQDASRILAEATTQAVKAIESAKAAALNDFASQLNANLDRLQQAGGSLNAAIEKLQAAASAAATTTTLTAAATSQPARAEAAPAEAPASTTAPVAPDDATPVATAQLEAPANDGNHSESVPHAPKRSRKPRREEPAPTSTATPPAEPAPLEPAPAPASEPEVAPVVTTEPDPAAAVASPEGAPVTPTPEPPPAPAEPAPAAPDEPAPAEKIPAAPAEKPARKRPSRKADDDQPGLGLELDEPSHQNGEASGVVERVLTSDGATRLIVTAYIGIGNRLFIRGDGPGLSWDKGVPLQFVSIGKWRWETMDATTPVQLKLLKNDEQECAALGTLSVEPGHQHEVTANF